MTILRVGSTPRYASNFDKAFGGKKKSSPKASAKKKASPKKAAKKK
ncbi:MAG: hypothetical protein VX876_04090 [Planctomycetota bacterium]|nr:hypothetical protein [Planctomycetota bacterium]